MDRRMLRITGHIRESHYKLLEIEWAYISSMLYRQHAERTLQLYRFQPCVLYHTDWGRG